MTRYIDHCNCIAVHMVTWTSSNFLFWEKSYWDHRPLSWLWQSGSTPHSHHRLFKTWCHCKNVIATKLSKASLNVDLHIKRCFAMAIYIVRSWVPLRISFASWFANLCWWCCCLSMMNSFTCACTCISYSMVYKNGIGGKILRDNIWKVLKKLYIYIIIKWF